MTRDETCCGYANYETFTIAVVVGNDRKLIGEARAFTLDAVARLAFAFEVAEEVRRWVEERFITPVIGDGSSHHSIAGTLCGSALNRVAWDDLVAEWLQEEGT